MFVGFLCNLQPLISTESYSVKTRIGDTGARCGGILLPPVTAPMGSMSANTLQVTPNSRPRRAFRLLVGRVPHFLDSRKY